MSASNRLHEDDLVPPPHATRKAAWTVAIVVLAIPVVLLLAPWRQNVASRGRVVAVDPGDRKQLIPAPVTGRITNTHVVEGSHVEEGQVILEMADLDPMFSIRLEQQVALAREKLRAARDSAGFLKQQVESLAQYRNLAVTTAEFERDIATQKVLAADQAVLVARAAATQKVADRDRKKRLHAKSLASELTLQKAVADAEVATAKVREAEAKLEQSRHEESAKRTAVEKTRNELEAKLDSARSKLEESNGKVSIGDKELQDALTKIGRQNAQVVRAPRAGIVLKINAAGNSEYVKKGEALIEFVPDTSRFGAEVWVPGNDVPLITAGRRVRLQFEGWPAVQFVGWPSAARGTFGGIVSVVDSHDDGHGRFRLVVQPDPDDVAWPDARYLRQGARVKAWVLLDEVSLGFEIWRQLNGFPPSLDSPPEEAGKERKEK